MNLDLDKIAKKRQYKLRGIFIKYEAINSYFGKVFISKGTGTKKKIFVFTAKGHLTNQLLIFCLNIESKYGLLFYVKNINQIGLLN